MIFIFIKNWKKKWRSANFCNLWINFGTAAKLIMAYAICRNFLRFIA